MNVPAPIAAVFGGSAARPGDPAYQEGEALGRLLAGQGFTVATGGYIGLMEAVSKGAAQGGGAVIGATCDQIERWRGVRPNRWVERQVRYATLRERLYGLIEMADVLIALPGGVGTLSELSVAWSLLQTQEIDLRPLILVGATWRQMINLLADAPGGFLRPGDVGLLAFARDIHEAAQLAASLARRRGQQLARQASRRPDRSPGGAGPIGGERPSPPDATPGETTA